MPTSGSRAPLIFNTDLQQKFLKDKKLQYQDDEEDITSNDNSTNKQDLTNLQKHVTK